MKRIASATIEISEDRERVYVTQLDSKITLSNINDVNLLIDVLSAFKHRFMLEKSFSYGLVYNILNEKNTDKSPP